MSLKLSILNERESQTVRIGEFRPENRVGCSEDMVVWQLISELNEAEYNKQVFRNFISRKCR